MPFMFEIGKEYETQVGEKVTVLGRTDSRGYECLECSDGRYRYDRSDGSQDAGRCTGTAHDYSDPHNFKRADRTPSVLGPVRAVTPNALGQATGAGVCARSPAPECYTAGGNNGETNAGPDADNA